MFRKRYQKSLLIGILIIAIILLGMGYSAWTGAITIVNKLSTTSFKFKFTDIKMTRIYNNIETELLESKLNYNNDNLYVTDLDMSELDFIINTAGEIRIYYKMTPQEDSLKLVKCGDYPLGNIAFSQSSYSNSLTFNYGEGTISCDSNLIGEVALPDYSNKIRGINHVDSCEEGNIKGYVSLVKSESSAADLYYRDNAGSYDLSTTSHSMINLSELGLPESVIKYVLEDEEASYSLTLETTAYYSFNIPISLEQNYK